MHRQERHGNPVTDKLIPDDAAVIVHLHVLCGPVTDIDAKDKGNDQRREIAIEGQLRQQYQKGQSHWFGTVSCRLLSCLPNDQKETNQPSCLTNRGDLKINGADPFDYTWPITVPQTERYKVYGTWNSGSSRASNAKYTHNAGPNEQTSIQNQRLNVGQWNLLREYSFDFADNQNGQNNVSLSAEANGYLIADAIKLGLNEENQPVPSGLFFIHNDHLGTPTRLTDTQGQVVWSLETTPFGEIHEEIANGITLLMGFPGQYRDSETSLSYNYYRDYDPSIGRHIQSDPIGLDGGGWTLMGMLEGIHQGLLTPLIFLDVTSFLDCPRSFGNGTTETKNGQVIQIWIKKLQKSYIKNGKEMGSLARIQLRTGKICESGLYRYPQHWLARSIHAPLL